jgi:hypothetical protein
MASLDKNKSAFQHWGFLGVENAPIDFSVGLQCSNYIQRASCCDTLFLKTIPLSAHRWNKLRIYARAVGRLVSFWYDCQEARYAPGANGFFEAQRDFEHQIKQIE